MQEVHGFADASERAYGCGVYIRCVHNFDNVNVQLWTAKSRIAPLKTKSLPRLELMAAHLLSLLMVKTVENLPMMSEAIYLWSDSEIVLEWLSAHPSTWTTFVANRVSSIQEVTKQAIWRHVPSGQNPADIVSRGAYADELSNSIWFTGSPFLMKPCAEWPANKRHGKDVQVNEERRKSATLLVAEINSNHFLHWLEGRNDFRQTQRIVAYCLCVGRRIKGEQGNLPLLTAEVLDEAMIRIAYCLQQHFFAAEYRELKKNREIPASSKVRSLCVFIEASCGVEVLRVGGRLRNSDLPYDVKYPILLPGVSSFVRSFVRFVHIENKHVGTEALIASE
ncbi:uncharacterized protein LOC118756526 [Rhagoletis pomonella]|uniref:uncharacterized protein LOC118756526 n=1 Tax=Rhagoletis pomonella TaxID=28610 RepID=UPI0017860E3F|nr:uncharacterized protein LOC118756526 [Rhagoletis pomonella]